MGKRYSVRALLVLQTAFAVLLGYSQWRRQRLLSQIEAMRDAGATVYVRQDGWARAWMPSPRNAQLEVKEASAGTFVVGGRTLTLAQADERIVQFRRRLRGIGVKSFVVEAQMKGGSRHQILYDLEQSEEANNKYIRNGKRANHFD
jgi:hypothetical protein